MKKITLFETILCVIIILFGIFLRLKAYCSNLSFWCDEEALILNAMPILTGEAFFWEAPKAEYAPPFLLLFGKFIYKIFGLNEIAFRFIPFFASVITLPAFACLAKKIIKTPFLYLLPLLYLAINEHLLFNSQYFKFYSTDVLITILIAIAIFSIDFEKFTRKKAIICSICASVLCWSAYSGIFYFAGISTILFFIALYKREKTYWKNYAIITIPAFLLTLFYYYELKMQESHINYVYNAWFDIGEGSFFPKTPDQLSYIIFYHTTIFDNIISVLFILVCLIGLILIFKKYPLKTILFISSLIMMLIAAALNKFPFIERQTLSLMPIWLILMTSSIDFSSWKNINKFATTIPIICLFLICFIFKNFDTQYIQEITNNPNYFRMSTAREFYPYLMQEYKKEPNEKIYMLGRDSALRLYDYNNKNIDIDNALYEDLPFLETLNIIPDGCIIHMYIAKYPYIGETSIKNYEYIKENYPIEKTITDSFGTYVKFKKIKNSL